MLGEFEALGCVQRLAEALRDEFGVGIDAHPGGGGNGAGAVNRAFVAAARVILAHCEWSEGDLTDVIRRVALLRLSALGISTDQAVRLGSSEPELGDRWLAYLALAPSSVIEDLTG